ncbi:SMP-30/gluconolactonase/LRE family protein [Mesobacillus foraminis]|uniref:SMP-30/gluconolactonase/LRE family protein n=1 Tax=Mesobacillus foraminis TaxID=279826 RepID=UPI000EF46C2C|nr:SMP-30/gluconolactonase/LRE family protein [Mesobacillus foraminis]MBT2759130.1 SMP-30/gluconolactonase/LRE family protein [Mesobacillus foraminis]
MEKSVKVEKVQGGQLLEGPFWDQDHKRLLCVDILGKKLISYHPEAEIVKEYVFADHVTSAVVDHSGSIFLSLRNQWVLYDEDKGITETVVSLNDLGPSMRFNDGKVDPHGRFWIGTMSEDGEQGAASLYMINKYGTLTESKKGLTISNGLAWNKAGTTMYLIDTPTEKIWSFGFSKETDSLEDGQVVFDFEGMDGSPDGMTIDENDRLWVALWGGSSVVCIDPEEGMLVDRIPMPVSNVTSCAFGGGNRKTLYITTAKEGLTSEQLTQEPLAGSLFSCEMEMAGAPSRVYESVKFIGSER